MEIVNGVDEFSHADADSYNPINYRWKWTIGIVRERRTDNIDHLITWEDQPIKDVYLGFTN